MKIKQEIYIKYLCKLLGAMNEEDIRNRKKYIEEVRKSFPDCGIKSSGEKYRNCLEKENDVEAQAAGIGAGIKIRFFLSVLLFAIFFFCEKNDISILGFSSEDITEKIEENYDYTNLEKYVMMVFNSDI